MSVQTKHEQSFKSCGDFLKSFLWTKSINNFHSASKGSIYPQKNWIEFKNSKVPSYQFNRSAENIIVILEPIYAYQIITYMKIQQENSESELSD